MYTYGNVTKNELNGDIVDRMLPEPKEYDRHEMTESQRNELLIDIQERTKENQKWHKEWLRWKATTLTMPSYKHQMIGQAIHDGLVPTVFRCNAIEMSLLADYYKHIHDSDEFMIYAEWVGKVVKNG